MPPLPTSRTPSGSIPLVFFGYPFKPAIRQETVVTAIERLEKTGAINGLPWERLEVNGQFIIDRILVAIDGVDVAAFDVTELNHNVMFELGYAIGKDKKVWLFRDDSEAEAHKDWNKVKILTTVGYSPFTNSQHIVDSFWTQRPHQAATTIYQSAVKDYLQPGGAAAILYLPSLIETEAERKLSRRILQEERKGIRCIIADPAESAVQPLAWYAQRVYSADAVVAHFASPRRQGAGVHNARCALIAGLAQGMNKQLLMLAEEDYASPIDYRDLMYVYPSGRACLERADDWLENHLAATYGALRKRPSTAAGIELAVELRGLRMGDPIAENEADELAEYFIETAAFDEVLERKTTVFIGRKGTGKTANMLRAADRLVEDKRNLVCVIKPFSYELEGLVALLRRYREIAEQGFLIESLWKFLIYSEIANEALREIRGRPVQPTDGSPEARFVEYMEENEELQEEFAVRLERSVDNLLGDAPTDGSKNGGRARISEALHAGAIQELRQHLGRVLSRKARIAVLIDNLDKAWRRTADIALLVEFLLGLLGTIGRVDADFANKDQRRKQVGVTLAVFLRSDIFEHVLRAAREPDKIQTSRLTWTDSDLLLRVVEERYLASQPSDTDPKELWRRFFSPTVRHISTPEYILQRILPRPRDLIYFVGAAIASAVNRRSAKVEEQDIDKAESLYSQFAFEALLVENGISVAELEGVLYEFAGSEAVVDAETVAGCMRRAGLRAEQVDEVIDHLRSLSFLGLQVGEAEFDYAYEFRRRGLAEALARRHSWETGKGECFEIHPAFRSYLGIVTPSPALSKSTPW